MLATEKMNLNEIYKFLAEIIPACGDIIRDTFYKEKNVQQKTAHNDLVTETDRQIESLFEEAIKKKYPDHHFIGEETANDKIVFDERPVWIIDPVDGTTNFVHTFPYCCVAIAFCVDKIVQIGVIYNPISDEFYSAIRGQGAFLNGQLIKPTVETSLENSLILTGLGFSKDEDKNKIIMENIGRIGPKCHGLRCVGSAALDMCLVASGAADAYFYFGIHIWDIAAGSLIAKEAGCIVCDPVTGKELDLLSRRAMVVCTNVLAQQLIPFIKEIKHEKD